jgi:hypothetical protein
VTDTPKRGRKVAKNEGADSSLLKRCVKSLNLPLPTFIGVSSLTGEGKGIVSEPLSLCGCVDFDFVQGRVCGARAVRAAQGEASAWVRARERGVKNGPAVPQPVPGPV